MMKSLNIHECKGLSIHRYSPDFRTLTLQIYTGDGYYPFEVTLFGLPHEQCDALVSALGAPSQPPITNTAATAGE